MKILCNGLKWWYEIGIEDKIEEDLKMYKGIES